MYLYVKPGVYITLKADKQRASKRMTWQGSPLFKDIEVLDDSFFRILIPAFHAMVNGLRIFVMNCLWQNNWNTAERGKILKIPGIEHALSQLLSNFKETLALNNVQLTKARGLCG